MSTVTLWDRERRFVWGTVRGDGSLVIEGQDLSGGAEYEYAITVPAAQVPTVAAALGVDVEDVLSGLAAQGEAVYRRGELTWVRSLGITPEFWSRSD
ncbi:MAG TPA: hypothetical protein VN257_01145 [Actinotalea sp.]|nr:hypothetical protein [Actinotalea sp.]